MAMIYRRQSAQQRAPDTAQLLAERIRMLLALEDEASVTVSEIACGHAACGSVETVVLLMRPGRRTQARKINRPLASVTHDDLVRALGGWS